MKTLNRFFSAAVFLCVILLSGGNPGDKVKRQDRKLPVRVEPVLISQAGPEHFGNAVYRRGLNGPGIAASGSRILQWPVSASAPASEVVPKGRDDYQNGACVMDINGDGTDEMIVGRTTTPSGTDLMWFEEIPGQNAWKEHLVAHVRDGEGEKGLHDIMPVELNIPGRPVRGVATVVNRMRILWYRTPDEPDQPWKEYLVSDLGMHGAGCAQSGLAVGDITGAGRPDLVCGNFWAECPADPTTESWKIHRYSNWDQRTTPVFPGLQDWIIKTRFGGMNQLDLGDLNNDGTTDIVSTDAEIPQARVAVFCRDHRNPDGLWTETTIDTGIYCPHSLVVTDVNADNRADILVGEMTAGGWYFPRNPDPKLYLYLNQGSLKFRRYVLHHGWGTHMMRLAPQQDQIGIFIFAADEIQSWYPDMITHVVGWTIRPLRQ